jgi:hypothetical protein
MIPKTKRKTVNKKPSLADKIYKGSEVKKVEPKSKSKK